MMRLKSHKISFNSRSGSCLTNHSLFYAITKSIAITVLLFLSSDWANAQPLEKNKIDTEFHITGHLEYYLEGSHLIFLDANYQRGDEMFGRLGNSPFSERFITIGYEHFIRERWQAGFAYSNYKAAVDGRSNYYTGYFRHNGRIKSLIFSKKLSVSLLKEIDTPNFESGNNTEFDLAVYLGKRYKIGNKLTMQTGFQYQVSKWHESIGESRTFDATELAFRHQILLKEGWVLECFAKRETIYTFALETIGQDGVTIIKPYRRLNTFTPIYGFSLRIALKSNRANTELPFNLWGVPKE